MSAMPKFYRLKEIKEITGLGTSSIYYLISRNLFVKQVKLGEKALGWPVAKVDAGAADRVASRTESLTLKEQHELSALLACLPEMGAASDTSGMTVQDLRGLLRFLRRKAQANSHT